MAEAGKDGDTTVAVVVAEAGKDMDADAMVAEGVAEAAPPHQLLPPPPTVRRSTPLRHLPVRWTTQRRLWAPAPTCAQVNPLLAHVSATCLFGEGTSACRVDVSMAPQCAPPIRRNYARSTVQFDRLCGD